MHRELTYNKWVKYIHDYQLNKYTQMDQDQFNKKLKKMLNANLDLIEKKHLTEDEVIEIVRLWYTNGMYEGILQDEDGLDLEEICEQLLYNK